ncbi:MAG: chlorite dismutase family protein [Planctomycetota bacterium]
MPDSASPDLRRQFVTFTGYKLDRTFRQLGKSDRHAAAEEFAAALDDKPDGTICLTYSCVGLKRDTDLLVWRIAFETDAHQQHTAALNKTRLAGYLEVTHHFLSMTKRSQYIDPVDPFHDADSRTRIVPGRRKYLFVYPFVKTRPWYLLPQEKRHEIMMGHIKKGNEYPSVKLNTTYSFGLDDQDFVVAFETDEPKDFLDLVQELRETESSLYTERDQPMFTAVQMPTKDVLAQLF